MARLPQRYAPFVYGIIQAAITTAVATAIATHQVMDFKVPGHAAEVLAAAQGLAK